MNQTYSDWSINNKEYWDIMAIEYDQLYLDQWSNLENRFIGAEMEKLNLNGCRILDLGCGTGLGYSLCAKNDNIDFIGLDCSIEMLKQFNKNYPLVKLINASMSDLSQFDSGYFDVIISTFTALSYADDIGLTIAQMNRILKPEGKVLLSVMSKWSLRRLLNFKFGKKEHYKTRKSKHKKYTYAWVFSPKEIKKLFLKYNFKNIDVRGYNAFSGIMILQKPWLWPTSRKLGKLLPFLSHELIVTFKNESHV
ncbi:MAG: methyltransferase domain-containing protein [Bacteroidetes bacterium]|nr:methyltransferase domain-containing protein [Bacteroidota bacterium]